jgi:hypothetical protein
MGKILTSWLAILALLIATPALAQQPVGYLSPPSGAPTYVTANSPLPILNETFSSTGTTTLSTSTATANVALPGNGQLVQVSNGGSVVVYVALGIGSGTTATTSGYAIQPGWTVFLNTAYLSAGIPTYLAGITASSTATLTVTTGTLVPLMGSGGTYPYVAPSNYVRGTASTTGGSATSILPAAGAGLKNYVTALQCFNTSATTITATMSDAAASVFGIPAGGGTNPTFPVPLVTAANTAFTFTPSAGETTITCNAQGYTGP